MGESSQTIGKKLEDFWGEIAINLGWDILCKNISIDCQRSNHKSFASKNGIKTSHGIDLLQSYYNPFSARKEAVVIECKNHLWSDFIPSNINKWIEELTNTIECSSNALKVSQYLTDNTLTTGILLFNSSDNKYDFNKARDTLGKIVSLRRRTPTMIYLADTGRLEKWYALSNEITKIKDKHNDHNFSIIYPSINGSQWDRKDVITPSYLFSDFIFAGYTQTNTTQNGTEKIDVKVIFSFDTITDNSMLYLIDMVNNLQLESQTERKLEIHIYCFPENNADRDTINNKFTSIIAPVKPGYKLIFLDNRRLSIVP